MTGAAARAVALAAAAIAPAVASGELPPGPGRDDVEVLCSACHSLAIVTQQRLSRRVWDEVLVWMVEEQGMPMLEPDERRRILDYLAQNYAPDRPR